MIPSVKPFYFSPTGTTKRVALAVAQRLGERLGAGNAEPVDFTLPGARKDACRFQSGDLVIAAVPVYAGRVPNVLLNYLNEVEGNGAKAVAVVAYGNRNYDDALIELVDVLTERGFKVVGAGAFIGEHSFSTVLGQGRPDADDLALARSFADRVADKLAGSDRDALPEVKGNRPYRPYYRPRDGEGAAVDFRKIKPKTSENCVHCGTCADLCPMGAIDRETSDVVGICIKCGACIKGCPIGAKFYDDENYLRHKRELEIDFARRAEPELFV